MKKLGTWSPNVVSECFEELRRIHNMAANANTESDPVKKTAKY
jgi:hypothetical protein